jgi:hypothetical protein
MVAVILGVWLTVFLLEQLIRRTRRRPDVLAVDLLRAASSK